MRQNKKLHTETHTQNEIFSIYFAFCSHIKDKLRLFWLNYLSQCLTIYAARSSFFKYAYTHRTQVRRKKKYFLFYREQRRHQMFYVVRSSICLKYCRTLNEAKLCRRCKKVPRRTKMNEKKTNQREHIAMKNKSGLMLLT